MIPEILSKADRDAALTPAEIKSLLEITGPDDLQALYACAYRVKARHVGRVVYFRGLIECGNFCSKDCYYCGIRKSNHHVKRFQMDEDEIVREALWAFNHHYGSAVIQAGERQDTEYINLIERALVRIRNHTADNFGITLSLGEQSPATYRRWHAAGANRYLLRIETTNPKLYRKLHPPNHSFQTRINCLKTLRESGYQLGTGVMTGLPGQSTADLTHDILFMHELDVDMVGMGPYIPHHDTPLGNDQPPFTEERKLQALTLGLKMIAVTRIVLKNVNIAAATALQALAPGGRIMGLQCGANVMMPVVTHPEFRPHYILYDDKPCINETADCCRDCLTKRIEKIGESVGFNQPGDSLHYKMRNEKQCMREGVHAAPNPDGFSQF